MIIFSQIKHYISQHSVNHLTCAVTFCSILIILAGCQKEDDIDPIAPVACFDTPAGELFARIPINFNASCSKGAVRYHWEFNDGWTSSQKEFSRTFLEPGGYTLALTVTDSLGNSKVESKSFSVQASPYIIHEGIIETQEIWQEGLHLIENDVFINGGSVIIEPGAEILFNKGKSIYIGDTFEGSSLSSFKAEGTASKPISFKPVSGIDAPGEWGHLYFTENASPESSLVHCNISYGGNADLYRIKNDSYDPNTSQTHGIVNIRDNHITIENTTIKGGFNHGIKVFRNSHEAMPGFTSFNNNILTENNGRPLMLETNGVQTLGENNRYPGEKPILVYGWNYTQEKGSWKKQEVPYEIADLITIGLPSYTGPYELTIEPGVEILFRKEGFMSVEISGLLNAIGTASAPIVFSSAEAVKAKGDWVRVQVRGVSSFEYCIFEYGGSIREGLLQIDAEGSTVNNCTFRESLTDGLIFMKGDLANSSNNIFSSCTRFGITVSANLAHLVNSSHTFDCAKNIHIRAVTPGLSENATWIKRNFPYYFSGRWSIINKYGGTGSLTIAPGTEIRFLPKASISVDGAFIADGTSEPIIFTLDEDYRSNKENFWEGILFNSETLAGSKMINCNVSYGGNNPEFPSIGMIHCSSTSSIPTLKDNKITNSAGHGISLDSATPIMSGNSFSGNTGTDVYTN